MSRNHETKGASLKTRPAAPMQEKMDAEGQTAATGAGAESAQGPQRSGRDRRKAPTPPLSRYTLWGGRRKGPRRPEDAEVHRFVDLYDNRFLLPLLTLLGLSLVDALFTLHFINAGAREMNPVMDFFLRLSGETFYYVKFGATALGLLILCWLKNFGRVQQILRLLCVMYGMVVLNHLILFGLYSVE